jgi:hypothetical protein
MQPPKCNASAEQPCRYQAIFQERWRGFRFKRRLHCEQPGQGADLTLLFRFSERIEDVRHFSFPRFR